MRKKIHLFLCSTILFALIFPVWPRGSNHLSVLSEIREEGFMNSHIMEDVSYLTDVYGPRLAKSPSYLAAARWVKKKFEEYGLSNVKLDPYEFGVGWQNDYTSVHMVAPQYMPIIAYPQSWSAETQGKVSGPVIAIDFQKIGSESDLIPYKSKLRNAFVFASPIRKLTPNFQPDAVLLSEKQLDEMSRTSLLPQDPEVDRRYKDEQKRKRRMIVDFLAFNGAVAVVTCDQVYDDGTVMVTKVPGTPWKKNMSHPITELVMAAEHYNRIMRIMEKGLSVEMEAEIRVSVSDKDLTDHNVLADLPGSDLAHEIVMVGAHLDAHAGATGAEDNATGVAQVLEAARILRAIGAKPRRTIRFALWGGEETGHMGSKAYVAQHFIDRETGDFTDKHTEFSGYFNLDYGTGKIRGIYLMNNIQALPISREWMKPFHDIGMTHCILVPGQDIGSDHVQFEAVGLPVFPFLQDPVENDSRTFHSNMDVYDRIVPEYLMQGAVIVAGILYQAALHDTKLPRIEQ